MSDAWEVVRMGDTPGPDWWSTSGGPYSPAGVRGDEDAGGDRGVPNEERVIVRDAPGPGWWLASDGRYYPPELARGGPVPPGPAVPQQSRPPVYTRAWFWIVIGLGTLVAGVVSAFILLGILIWSVPIEPPDTSGASPGPEASTMVVVESMDFATVAEGTTWTGDDWSATVSGGTLNITPTERGGAYPFWAEFDAADEAQVTATMSWADGALAAPDGLLGGITVVSGDGGAYGLACGNDGNVYTLLIDDAGVTVLDVNGYGACVEDQFTLTMTVTGGSTTDSLSVQLPGGPSYMVFSGSSLAPFTDQGFMALAEVGDPVPGIGVHSFEVLVSH